MHNKPRDYFYNINELKAFYTSLKSIDFTELTIERRKEIEYAVEKLRPAILLKSCHQLSLMCVTAEKLRISGKHFGAETDTEKAYFFLKMVDPSFKFLEIYEVSNKTGQTKEICMQRFQMFDGNIIKLERLANKQLSIYDKNDLWANSTFNK